VVEQNIVLVLSRTQRRPLLKLAQGSVSGLWLKMPRNVSPLVRKKCQSWTHRFLAVNL